MIFLKPIWCGLPVFNESSKRDPKFWQDEVSQIQTTVCSFGGMYFTQPGSGENELYIDSSTPKTPYSLYKNRYRMIAESMMSILFTHIILVFYVGITLDKKPGCGDPG